MEREPKYLELSLLSIYLSLVNHVGNPPILKKFLDFLNKPSQKSTKNGLPLHYEPAALSYLWSKTTRGGDLWGPIERCQVGDKVRGAGVEGVGVWFCRRVRFRIYLLLWGSSSDSLDNHSQSHIIAF